MGFMVCAIQWMFWSSVGSLIQTSSDYDDCIYLASVDISWNTISPKTFFQKSSPLNVLKWAMTLNFKCQLQCFVSSG